jgi:hypothetical protein
MLVFLLAEDAETGRIVEDHFITSIYRYASDGTPINSVLSKSGRKHNVEISARDVCQSWKLKFIDCDDPFSELFWRLGHGKPKWADRPPTGIDAHKWTRRFKSIDQLNDYKDGLKDVRLVGR